MNTVDIINKKRLGCFLTKEEISYMVMGYVQGEIPDYQMSAFLMSICLKGMNDEEIFFLTDTMLHSGHILDTSFLGLHTVDKHSTGGVGDKTTLVVAPLVASTGVNVIKMSGRGLGFTGGTIDKLESIEGLRTYLTEEELKNQVESIHVCIASGGKDLVLADKKMYALRDVTGTVESIPLIASSIMSKKIAAGSKKIVMDVKVGNGALMKTKKEAEELSKIMIQIGKRYGVVVECVLSSMDFPLGYAIGNGLEVKESIEALQGKFAPDFYELVLTLASQMVALGLEIPLEEAREKVVLNLENGQAYQTFLKLVENQHGNIEKVDLSNTTYDVFSEEEGYITSIDALHLAKISSKLGAGRENLNDEIDYGVGLWLLKKTGDFVKKGEALLRVYYRQKKIEQEEILKSYKIEQEKREVSSILLGYVK